MFHNFRELEKYWLIHFDIPGKREKHKSGPLSRRHVLHKQFEIIQMAAVLDTVSVVHMPCDSRATQPLLKGITSSRKWQFDDLYIGLIWRLPTVMSHLTPISLESIVGIHSAWLRQSLATTTTTTTKACRRFQDFNFKIDCTFPSETNEVCCE